MVFSAMKRAALMLGRITIGNASGVGRSSSQKQNTRIFVAMIALKAITGNHLHFLIFSLAKRNRK